MQQRARVALAIGFIMLLTGCGGPTGTVPTARIGPEPVVPGNAATRISDGIVTPYGAAAGTVQHVVIIFQENRTPDNLFHGLANADIANSGLNSQGQTIQLQPIPLVTHYDLGHKHKTFEQMYDNGKMDGANLEYVTCGNSCPYTNPQYGYVPPSQVKPYFEMAAQYTFGDRMFQTNQGGSFPAHQYIISGTSIPSVGSDLLAAENPTPFHVGAGCKAPSDSSVKMIDPAGNENTSMYPCFEHPVLMDLLDQAGVTWKYYANSATGIWTGPDAIKHIDEGADFKHVDLNSADVLKDIAAQKLASVSWVIPKPADSDHAVSNDGSGPSWVASVVNAIGNSSYWNNTTIFVTWDDWGGWYDHVAPPNIFNSYELGFRVPLLVISPYAKYGYVSHVNYEFGSFLKYIEETYGLPSLGYTDQRANDLSDCFNFKRQPRKFTPIKAPLDASYFMRTANIGLDAPEDY